MNLKINLVDKSRKRNKSKSVLVAVFSWVFLIVFVLFLGSVFFVTYKIFALKGKINKVSAEAINISSEIRENSEVVNKYVLTKSILDYVSNLENEKFDYKRYLDEVVAILPPGLILRNVDFQTKGWLSVGVFVPDLSSLKGFEERIYDKSIIDQTMFDTIFSEGIVKERTGGYIIKLQFELKKNV